MNVINHIAPSKMKISQVKIGSVPLFFYIYGTYKCKKPKCKACAFVKNGQKEFTGKNGRVYKVNQFITCGTGPKVPMQAGLSVQCEPDSMNIGG